MTPRQGLAGPVVGQISLPASAAVERPEFVEKSGSQPGTGTGGRSCIEQAPCNVRQLSGPPLRWGDQVEAGTYAAITVR